MTYSAQLGGPRPVERMNCSAKRSTGWCQARSGPTFAENRREATFSWLDGWTQLVDEKTERSRGMTIEVSNWFWEGVMMQGGVLSIDPAYFDLTGGRER